MTPDLYAVLTVGWSLREGATVRFPRANWSAANLTKFDTAGLPVRIPRRFYTGNSFGVIRSKAEIISPSTRSLEFLTDSMSFEFLAPAGCPWDWIFDPTDLLFDALQPYRVSYGKKYRITVYDTDQTNVVFDGVIRGEPEFSSFWPRKVSFKAEDLSRELREHSTANRCLAWVSDWRYEDIRCRVIQRDEDKAILQCDGPGTLMVRSSDGGPSALQCMPNGWLKGFMLVGHSDDATVGFRNGQQARVLDSWNVSQDHGARVAPPNYYVLVVDRPLITGTEAAASGSNFWSFSAYATYESEYRPAQLAYNTVSEVQAIDETDWVTPIRIRSSFYSVPVVPGYATVEEIAIQRSNRYPSPLKGPSKADWLKQREVSYWDENLNAGLPDTDAWWISQRAYEAFHTIGENIYACKINGSNLDVVQLINKGEERQVCSIPADTWYYPSSSSSPVQAESGYWGRYTRKKSHDNSITEDYCPIASAYFTGTNLSCYLCIVIEGATTALGSPFLKVVLVNLVTGAFGFWNGRGWSLRNLPPPAGYPPDDVEDNNHLWLSLGIDTDPGGTLPGGAPYVRESLRINNTLHRAMDTWGRYQFTATALYCWRSGTTWDSNWDTATADYTLTIGDPTWTGDNLQFDGAGRVFWLALDGIHGYDIAAGISLLRLSIPRTYPDRFFAVPGTLRWGVRWPDAWIADPWGWCYLLSPGPYSYIYSESTKVGDLLRDCAMAGCGRLLYDPAQGGIIYGSMFSGNRTIAIPDRAVVSVSKSIDKRPSVSLSLRNVKSPEEAVGRLKDFLIDQSILGVRKLKTVLMNWPASRWLRLGDDVTLRGSASSRIMDREVDPTGREHVKMEASEWLT